MRLPILLAALAFAPLAHAETLLVRTADGRFAVSAQLEGRAPALFVFDSGGVCALTRDLAYAVSTEQFKYPDGATAQPVVLAPATTIDGHTAPLRFTLAREPARNGVVGAVGACLLPNAVVTFDPRRLLLDIHGAAQRGQRLVGPRARLVEAQRLASGWWPTVLAVPVRLNNAEGLAIVATGAQHSVINRRFAAAAGIDTPQEAAATTLDVAGQRRDRFTVAIDDGAHLALRAFADRPVMILGLDALADWRLVIDYPRDRIWFDPQ